MGQQMTVYDYRGVPFTDLTTPFTVAEKINEAGQGTLVISLNHPQLLDWQEKLILPGNLIFIQDDRAGNWGGVMDEPYDYQGDDLSVSLYSGEKLLDFRRSPDNTVKYNAPAGAIFAALIALGNAPGDMRVREGYIYGGGDPHELTLRGNMLYELAKRLAANSKMDFYFEPALDIDGSLIFKAHWLQRRGKSYDLDLVEGLHITKGSLSMHEDGPIQNDIMGYGQSSSWDLAPKSTQIDDTSKGKYGLRQGSFPTQANTPAGVESSTIAQVQKRKTPTKQLSAEAIDVKQDLFQYLDTGNSYIVSSERVGFTNGKRGISLPVRQVGKEFSNHAGEDAMTMKIMIEELRT